jgi:hypothetical protein
MVNTLEELISQIRRAVPQSDSIRDFKTDGLGQYVRFIWNGREFLVKRNFEAFELKNNNLFITGASMLIQAVLSSREKHHRVLEACIDVLTEAEEVIVKRQRLESGLQLVGKVKGTISKLAGRQPGKVTYAAH